jgi:hypothetical protein
MRKKFIKFLKQNRIDVELFMYYTEPQNNGFLFKKYKIIQEFFDKELCEYWIEKAFRWDYSSFDLNKLRILNQKWKEICKKENQKSSILKAIPNWIKKLKGGK